VVARARAILAKLEERAAAGGPSGSREAMLDELPLFAHQPPPSEHKPPAEPVVLTMLDAIHPDDVTPREAVELIYALKKARDDAR
ncbi:MAG TPA: hypothetical protein VD858_19690, partial [Reyranella sp.]|nr:hypothetical protein [Reyranella sp.]